MAIRYRSELIDFRGSIHYSAIGHALPVSDRHASTFCLKMAMTTKKRLIFVVFAIPMAIAAVYLALAYSFDRKHFGHNLYTLTLTGLFVSNTEENRNKVRAFRPALEVFGDGWNIYWTNEDGVILEADRMFGPVSRFRFEGTSADLETFLREDQIKTRSLLEALQPNSNHRRAEHDSGPKGLKP